MGYRLNHGAAFKLQLLIVLLCFIFSLSIPSFLFSTGNFQSEVDRLLNEGIENYRNGEYEKALNKFLEVLIKAQSRRELETIYFYLALSYFSLGDSENSTKYLTTLFQQNPDFTFKSSSLPGAFLGEFNKAKAKQHFSTPKPEEPREKEIKEEPVERKPQVKPEIRSREKEKKRGGKFPWIIGGLAAVGGGVALLLLGGKDGADSSANQPSGSQVGSIQVTSTPSGAAVYLDGTPKGQNTPCTISGVSPGSHTIRLEKDGYGNYKTSVSVASGEVARVSANLIKHTLTVTSPKNAMFWIVGDDVEIRWTTSGQSSMLHSEASVNLSAGSFSSANQMRLNRLRAARARPGIGMRAQKSREVRSVRSKRSLPVEPGRVTDGSSKVVAAHNGLGVLSPPRILGLKGSPGFLKSPRAASSGKVCPAMLSEVKIELLKAGQNRATISAGTPNDENFTWIVPAYLSDGKDYKVRISSTRDSSINATSPNFEVNRLVQWVKIPAGSFQMGDNFGVGFDNEIPVHTVNLDKYSISKYEATFAQYDRFCSETGRQKPSDAGWGRNQRPVINVSWHDSKAFCDWLSNRTGDDVHLPTEAQWEKAARGTDQRKYPWGNSAPNSSRANYQDDHRKTMPVGSYPGGASYYGVHDMAGNVWEWCADWWDENYYRYSPSENPQGPSSGTERVERGSAWCSSDVGLRTSFRAHSKPSRYNYTIGFRICKE